MDSYKNYYRTEITLLINETVTKKCNFCTICEDCSNLEIKNPPEKWSKRLMFLCGVRFKMHGLPVVIYITLLAGWNIQVVINKNTKKRDFLQHFEYITKTNIMDFFVTKN